MPLEERNALNGNGQFNGSVQISAGHHSTPLLIAPQTTQPHHKITTRALLTITQYQEDGDYEEGLAAVADAGRARWACLSCIGSKYISLPFTWAGAWCMVHLRLFTLLVVIVH